MINPISSGSGYYMNNPYGSMYSHQIIHNESYEDADLFIKLFEQVIRDGYNPNDPQIQAEIFSQGTLGGYDQLMPSDQRRIDRAVSAYWDKVHNL